MACSQILIIVLSTHTVLELQCICISEVATVQYYCSNRLRFIVCHCQLSKMTLSVHSMNLKHMCIFTNIILLLERNCCKHVLLYSMYSKQHFELFITFKELSLLWPTSRKKHYYNNEVIFKPKFRHLQGSTDFLKFISMECCVNNSQSICEFNNKLDLRILDRNWIWTQ